MYMCDNLIIDVKLIFSKSFEVLFVVEIGSGKWSVPKRDATRRSVSFSTVAVAVSVVSSQGWRRK
jgi:hypothetical protein